MREGQWTWNYNDDGIWNNELFDTKEGAIAEGTSYAKDDEEDNFYVGQIEPVKMPNVADADNILEMITEYVYEEVGEVSEDYLRHVKPEEKKELESALNEVILAWATKYKHLPTFYKIDNIEQILIDKD